MLMNDYSTIPQGQILNLGADLLNNGVSPVSFQNAVVSDARANSLTNISLSGGPHHSRRGCSRIHPIRVEVSSYDLPVPPGRRGKDNKKA